MNADSSLQNQMDEMGVSLQELKESVAEQRLRRKICTSRNFKATVCCYRDLGAKTPITLRPFGAEVMTPESPGSGSSQKNILVCYGVILIF